MPRGRVVFEGESVGESCRADREKKAGGGTGENEQKSTTAVLQRPGDGMEESERALTGTRSATSKKIPRVDGRIPRNKFR